MTPADVDRLRAARRVHIVGGSAAGKSVMADELGSALRLPVHHLDDIVIDYRTGLRRPTEYCKEAVREISTRERWLSEGIYLGWTDALMRSADVILWLDTVSARSAEGRIVRRFVASALCTARQRRGLGRVARFRDYVRHARSLVLALLETRRYHRGSDGDQHREAATPTRAATAASLRRYSRKTLRLGASEVGVILEAVRA